MSQPRSTRLAEKALAPVLGKSCVHYATKPRCSVSERSERIMMTAPKAHGCTNSSASVNDSGTMVHQ